MLLQCFVSSLRHSKYSTCPIGNRKSKGTIHRFISQYNRQRNHNSISSCIVWNHLSTLGNSRNSSSFSSGSSNMKLWALTTVWCSVTARAFSASSNTMPPLAEQRSKFDSPLIGKVMSYLDSSPDPFHCVQTSTQILEQAGFVKCDSNTIPEKGKFFHSSNYYFSKYQLYIHTFIHTFIYISPLFLPQNNKGMICKSSHKKNLYFSFLKLF